MGPSKEIAVIELTSNKIKVVLGYMFNEKILSLYTMTKDISSFVKNGVIADEDGLINALKELTVIKDYDKKLKYNIHEIILVLPSIGLSVYNMNKSTKVISSEQKVGKNDIYNIVYQVSTEPLENKNQSTIDVIPWTFKLDDGRQYINPPLEEVAATLSGKMLLYTLPSPIYQQYSRIVAAAGFKVKRIIISPMATVEIIDSRKISDLANGYLLVDIGSQFTTVSVARHYSLFTSMFFKRGGDSITLDIANMFRIPFDDAEKLKKRFGYSFDNFEFDPPILKNNSGDEVIEFKFSQLNEIVKQNLEDFASDLVNCISALFSTYTNKEKYINLPIVLVGGGAKLNGLVPFLRQKMPNTSLITTFTPTVVGSRDLSLNSCLGAIKIANIYRGALQDNDQKVASINRINETTKDQEEQDAKNDKNIHDGKEIL